MPRVFWWLFSAGLLCAQQHDVIPADIEEGARNFGNFCAACHGPDGNAMPDSDLSKPTLRHATTDDQIAGVILSGIPGTPMPPNTVNQRQLFTLVAYIRSLSTKPPRAASQGNAARGQAIFEGKGACLTCHRVRDKGSQVAPNLSDIGILRRGGELERSLTDPQAEVLSQNSAVVAVNKDGSTVRGRLLNADTHSVQIIDGNQQLRNLPKDSLRSFTRDTKSAMPSYKDRLTPEELADVVAYLTSLRGF
jgi:putative heme-binding domain-containing protein